MKITQRDFAVVLRDTSTVLLFDNNLLPCVIPERHFWQSCEPVNAAILAEYGLDVITIRPLKSDFHKLNEDEAEIHNVYLMRYLEGDLPDRADWYPLEVLDSRDDDLRTQIQSETVLAWYDYAWYDDFLQTVKSLSDEKPQQVRSWERSAIWRITAENDTRYIKVLPEMFAHEVPLTQWMQAQFPEKSPVVISSPQSNMLYLADFGQHDLMSETDLSHWKNAIRAYADLQVATVSHQQTLLEMGVPHRGLDWIETRLDDFFAEDANLTRGNMPLSGEDIARLREAIPQLKVALITLRKCSIPETLEHGDLWAGQIILHEGRYLITDWSDSAITFPFFSPVFFLTDIESTLTNSPEARDSLTATYLSAWSDYGDNLETILEAANLISNVYTAMRYHYDILPQMGQQWEMHNMIAYDMRLLLAKL